MKNKTSEGIQRKVSPNGSICKRACIAILAFLALSSMVASAQSTEEEAIKEVIKAETEAYYSRNPERWQSTWLQKDKVTRTLVANNYYSNKTGWENFGPEIIQWLKENPEPVAVEIANENYVIHQDGNVATAEYDQTLTIPSSDPDNQERTREHRVLVKQNGEWKIASQITHLPESFGSSPEAIETNLNETGYLLLRENKVDDAIEVFKLNVKLFPKSWNVYDSLGEAYAMAGDTEQAIKNYEKSVELNPDNEYGKEALAKLKQK